MAELYFVYKEGTPLEALVGGVTDVLAQHALPFAYNPNAHLPRVNTLIVQYEGDQSTLGKELEQKLATLPYAISVSVPTPVEIPERQT